MNILIMAQGQQRRLPELKHPKHLLEVAGEPILARTLRMLRDISGPMRGRGRFGGIGADGMLVTIVGSASDFSQATQRAGVGGMVDIIPSIIPSKEPGSCIVDGILAARLSWSSSYRTLILLGDVVWSWAALEAVLADRRPLVFCGTPVVNGAEGEIFAMAFDDPQAVEALCRTCPCRVDGSRARTFMNPQGGHLRRLLWWAQHQRGIRLPESKQTWHPDLYLPIDDWTDDVDTPEDVLALPDLAVKIELEERRRAADASLPHAIYNPPEWRHWVHEAIDRGETADQAVGTVMRRAGGRMNPARVAAYARNVLANRPA